MFKGGSQAINLNIHFRLGRRAQSSHHHRFLRSGEGGCRGWGGDGAEDTSCLFTHESTLLVCRLLFKGAIFFSITSSIKTWKTVNLLYILLHGQNGFFFPLFPLFMIILVKKETPKGAIFFVFCTFYGILKFCATNVFIPFRCD